MPLQLNNTEAARRFLQIITKERKSRKMLLPAPVQLHVTPSLWRAVISAQTLVAVSSFDTTLGNENSCVFKLLAAEFGFLERDICIITHSF